MSTDDSDRAPLRSFLEGWGAVGDSLWRGLDTEFGSRSVERGAHLARPGEALPFVVFVVRGLLRFYEIGADGADWNKGFAAENDLTGPFLGEVATWPAPRGLQALEPGRLLVCEWSAFQRRVGRDREFERWIGAYTAALLERKARRLRSFQQEDAAGRYRLFLAESPELARRLPQYHIASYLGITGVSLSRLRRKVRLGQAGSVGA